MESSSLCRCTSLPEAFDSTKQAEQRKIWRDCAEHSAESFIQKTLPKSEAAGPNILAVLMTLRTSYCAEITEQQWNSLESSLSRRVPAHYPYRMGHEDIADETRTLNTASEIPLVWTTVSSLTLVLQGTISWGKFIDSRSGLENPKGRVLRYFNR